MSKAASPERGPRRKSEGLQAVNPGVGEGSLEIVLSIVFRGARPKGQDVCFSDGSDVEWLASADEVEEMLRVSIIMSLASWTPAPMLNLAILGVDRLERSKSGNVLCIEQSDLRPLKCLYTAQSGENIYNRTPDILQLRRSLLLPVLQLSSLMTNSVSPQICMKIDGRLLADPISMLTFHLLLVADGLNHLWAVCERRANPQGHTVSCATAASALRCIVPS